MPRKPRVSAIKIPIGADMPEGRFTFFGIPDWLFIDHTVGWGAKLVYAVVSRFSKTWTFPVGGMEFIQDVLQISRGELFKRLNELENAGFIRRSLDERYERRIRITPINNPTSEAYYESDDDAFQMWARFRQNNCLQTETLRKYKEYPNGDITDVVEYPNGDTRVSKRRQYVGSLPYSSQISSQTLKEDKRGCAENTSPSQGQNLPELPIPQDSLKLEQINSPAPAADFEMQSTLKEISTLQLEDDVLDFVKNAYTQSRGAKKMTKTELRRWESKIRDAESASDPTEFRSGLLNYLNTVSDYLRTNKWPIGVFLKNPTIYSPPVLAYRASQDAPPILPAPTTSSETQTIAAASSAPTHLTLVYEWNTMVPELAVNKPLLSFQAKQVEKQIQNPEFMEVWHEVLTKCSLMANHRPEDAKQFMWVFEGTQSGPNWQGLVNGKWDWCCKPKGGSQGSSMAEELAREAEKAERERKL